MSVAGITALMLLFLAYPEKTESLRSIALSGFMFFFNKSASVMSGLFGWIHYSVFILIFMAYILNGCIWRKLKSIPEEEELARKIGWLMDKTGLAAQVSLVIAMYSQPFSHFVYYFVAFFIVVIKLEAYDKKSYDLHCKVQPL
ncbi:hypothetical protein [Pseudomonas putida]|uniref:Uncharacterized protein n=1 Tax=Pseudomonas putida TaxID=303 RepID=A0A8I1JKB1_PSEPU|nr:hypothetical protein [Pseudomonas putida]MBI6883270.1 hypothetical protein [Pseudomonas putida]